MGLRPNSGGHLVKTKLFSIPVVVTGTHVHKGKCGDMHLCAISKAVLDSGFRAVETTNDRIIVANTLQELNEYGDQLTVLNQLPVRADRFIHEFDAVEDAPEKRNRLAARLDKKPIKLTFKLTLEQVKKFMTPKARKAVLATA